MTPNAENLVTSCPGFPTALEAERSFGYSQAHECARGGPPGPMAVRYGDRGLMAAGLNHNHLRFLICQGYAKHRLKRTPRRCGQRSFRPPHGLEAARASCFLLSESGLNYARNLRLELAHPPPNGRSHGAVAKGGSIPHWDLDRRELRLDRLVIKRFRQLASAARKPSSPPFRKTVGRRTSTTP